MTVKELNRDQLIELKQRYLSELMDEGCLNEILYDKPEWDEDGEHDISYEELASADKLIPDELVFDHYRDTHFTDGDFFCTENECEEGEGYEMEG